MQRLRLLVLLCLASLVAPPTWSQERSDEAAGTPATRQPAVPGSGFWPTDKMMDLFIDRMTEELAEAYGFDEDQLYNTRALAKERLPRWLNEHRGEIQQLGNEYFEAVLGRDAPPSDQVASWAQRVLPLVQEFTGVCEGVTEEMRPFMTETQQSQLEGQMAAFRVGTDYLSRRLQGWSEGGFDPAIDWYRSPQFREAERQRRREVRKQQDTAKLEALGYTAPPSGGAQNATPPGAETQAPPAAAGPRAEAPKDEWAAYVEDFIRRYQLGDDQKASAYKLLKAMQEQRDAYLRRNAERMASATQDLKEAKDEQQRQAAQELQGKLQRPLARMFQQLKDRLDQLPTRKQRITAAQSATESRGKSQSTQADSGAATPGTTKPGTPPP